MKAIAIVVAVLALAACTPPLPSGAAITIENARIGAPAPGASVAAAYFTIRNGGQADQLVAASSPAAASLELHETRNERGMMRMARLENVDLPSGGAVEFAPGGRHVMLIGLTQTLVEGSSFPITLTFRTAGAITVEAPVKAP